MRACMFTAIAFCPAKLAVPNPMPKLEFASSCGIEAIAPTAAMPWRAMSAVRRTCVLRPSSWICWPASACDMEVDTAFNWLRLTASVPSVPGATWVICRCWAALPTDTTFERPPSVEPWPSATEFEPVLTEGALAPGADMSPAYPPAVGRRGVLSGAEVESEAV